MRILTYEELSPELERDRSVVNMAAFGSVFSREYIELLRRLGFVSEYVGVFAVERNRVLGHIFVLRIPFAFPAGPETISGIAAVGTRPDVGRTGVARALLTDAHRREREAGLRHAALWTNRSWGAHGLYEKLGYRDVYSSPAVVLPPGGGGRRGPTLHFAKPSDLDEIDRLHNRMAEGRLGYCYRPVGTLRADRRLHYIDPATDILVARRRGRLAGYATVDRSPRRVICGEIVATAGITKRSLIAGVERVAKGLPCAFQHTPVRDSPELFRSRGSLTIPVSWYGMLGANLSREWTTKEAVREFATQDPRFICLAGDLF